MNNHDISCQCIECRTGMPPRKPMTDKPVDPHCEHRYCDRQDLLAENKRQAEWIAEAASVIEIARDRLTGWEDYELNARCDALLGAGSNG